MIVISILIVLVDQITKYLAVVKLKGEDSIDLIGNFLRFTYLENRGAAFGILSNARYFFIIATIVVIVTLIYMLYFNNRMFKGCIIQRISIYILLGGAIGNLIDRIRLGYVIDFIEIRFGKLYNFPVFNVADMAVVIGVILLSITILKEEKTLKE